MPDGKGHKRIQELVASLQASIAAMESGSLALGDLDRGCDDARELYERMVVLRHKAREATATPLPAAPPTVLAPPIVAPTVAATPAPEPVTAPAPAPEPLVEEAPSIRLHTTGHIDPRQVSLIDAIAETEETKEAKKAPKAPMVAPAGAVKPTLADRATHAPIKDLAKAVAVSQKFWFTAELFAKDASAYDQAMKRLNNLGNLAEAKMFIESEVLAKLKKPPAEDALAAFLELVERRFQ